MMIGARTAAWAKSGYTAKDYVQDGLIRHIDAIEHQGYGVGGYGEFDRIYDLVDPNSYVRCDYAGFHNVLIDESGFRATRQSIYMSLYGGVIGTDSSDLTVEYLTKSTTSKLGVVDVTNNFGWSLKFAGFDCKEANSYYVRWTTERLPDNFRAENVGRCLRRISVGNGVLKVSSNDGIDEHDIVHFTGSKTAFDVSRFPLNNYGDYSPWKYIRFYNRILSRDEMAHNWEVNKARFGLT